MQQLPLVSIITPCFNQEEFLSETILSVLQSTYPAIEMIIVDDGSTDESVKIAGSFAQSHPQITVHQQPNSGPSVARNRAIRLASGKYILPLDADDLISKDYVAKAVEVLEKDPKVKVVYCHARKIGNKEEYWKLADYSPPLLARKNMIFVSAMYRKADWQRCGGYAEEMTWGFEDWEFWISMLKDGGKVVRLPITGFFYRIRKQSRRKSVTKRGRDLSVNFINEKHRDFIYEHLHGPLRKSKTWSKPINLFLKTLGLLPKQSAR
jgi:glycosyltransferase involved in cell wall biosynthesis